MAGSDPTDAADRQSPGCRFQGIQDLVAMDLRDSRFSSQDGRNRYLDLHH